MGVRKKQENNTLADKIVLIEIAIVVLISIEGIGTNINKSLGIL